MQIHNIIKKVPGSKIFNYYRNQKIQNKNKKSLKNNSYIIKNEMNHNNTKIQKK